MVETDTYIENKIYDNALNEHGINQSTFNQCILNQIPAITSTYQLSVTFLRVLY